MTARSVWRVTRLATAIVPAVLCAAGVHAQTVPAAPIDASAPAESVPDFDWGPAAADEGEHDWIKFKTGEWLKGEIELIQDDTVEFDSAQLDDLEIDWEDVVALRAPGLHTFRFTKRRIVTGVGEVMGDVVRVRVADEVHDFDRKDFVSMIRGSGRELDYWKLNASVGLSGQAGNTQQLSFNTSFDLRRLTALTRSTVSYSGNVASQKDAISANNHRADFAFDIYLTRDFYLVLPSIEVFQDQFQNIDLRLTPGLGLGYQIVWTRKVKWEAGFSGGYQGTRYISVDSGSNTENDAALQFNTDFEIDLPRRFDWTNTYQAQVIVTSVGKSNQHVSSTLSFDFWGPLDLDTTVQWDWVADPVAGVDGAAPVSSDLRIIVGIALDL